MKIKTFIVIVIGIVSASCGKETIELSDNLKEIYNIYAIEDNIHFLKNKQDTITYSIANKIIEEVDGKRNGLSSVHPTQMGKVYFTDNFSLILTTAEDGNDEIYVNFDESTFSGYSTFIDTTINNTNYSRIYEFIKHSDTLYLSQKEGVIYVNVSNNIYELIE